MDFNKIEWKKITSCDICEHIGFVRENIDKDGRNMMDTCFYGCGDSRNIPTPENSICDYCYENRGTEEVFSENDIKLIGYYCERCKSELDSIIEEARQDKIRDEIEERKWEEERREYYENRDEMEEDAQRFFDGYYAIKEKVELFIDEPEIYSSYEKYLKGKNEFESRKHT